MPSPDAFLRVEGLTVDYGGTGAILAGLDLVVTKGQKVALVGPSGVGKSTLLHVISGLVAFTGTISADGHVPAASAVAMGFQEMILAENLSVIDNVNFVRSHRRGYAFTSDFYLELVGIGGYRHRSVSELSGGMRRRLSLARALAAERPILILDESLQEIDFETKRTLVRNLHLWPLWPTTTIIQTTHDPFEVFWIADRLVELVGSPARIVRDVAMGPDIRFAGIQFADARRAGLID